MANNNKNHGQVYQPKGWKNPGNILLGIGTFHQSLLMLIPELREPFFAAVRTGLNGVVPNGTIGGEPAFDRSLTNFFVLSGSLMLVSGWLMKCYIRDARRPVPRSVGWLLIAGAVAFGFLDVVSGAPTVVAVGAYIVWSDDGRFKKKND